MAAAQRWSRKRGWAAAFHGAEVVGQHYAANRGGVAIAGPLHISSSVPAEFESMLEEAAVLARGGVEQPLHYLRSRILARHTLAMLQRGVTLVTVYLEPGMRASGLNLWLLEVLAACILCFDGPWIAMGDWNLEPRDLPSTARFLPPRQQPVQEEQARFSTTSWCPRRWRIWCNRSKWYTTLPLHHIGQSDSHSTPRLRVTGFWRENSRSRCPRSASGTATPRGARRLDVGSRGTPCRLGAGVVGVAAHSRSSMVPCARPLRSPTQAFPWEEQRSGHRACFPRPGCRRANDTRSVASSKKAAALSLLATLLVAQARRQPGRLEEGANLAAHVTTVSSHWDPSWDFSSQEALVHTGSSSRLRVLLW